MKRYIIIPLFLILSLSLLSEGILDEERDAIVVETKADLQSDLELKPIDYAREITPDSLGRFNYSFHEKKLVEDYHKFPVNDCTGYINIGSGTHNVFTGDFYLNFEKNITYGNVLFRKDKNNSNVKYFNIGNKVNFTNHNFDINGYSYKSEEDYSKTRYAKNQVSNLSLSYSFLNDSLNVVKKFNVKSEFENNKNDTLINDSYVNYQLSTKLKVFPNFYFDGVVAKYHNNQSEQVTLYYESDYKIGIWGSVNDYKNVIAPIISYQIGNQKYQIKFTNNPYIKYNSFKDVYEKNHYGNYSNEKLDEVIPINSDLSFAYISTIDWKLGLNYKYILHSPVYTSRNNMIGLYNVDYYQVSPYLELSYGYRSLSFGILIENINYKAFNNDFIPFIPEMRYQFNINYRTKRWSNILALIYETGNVTDVNASCESSLDLKIETRFKISSKFSLWLEGENLLKKVHKDYSEESPKALEISGGVKYFF